MRFTSSIKLVLPIHLHLWPRHMQLLRPVWEWIHSNMLWWISAKPSSSGIGLCKLLHDWGWTSRTLQPWSWPKLWCDCPPRTITNANRAYRGIERDQWSFFVRWWSMQAKLWSYDDLPRCKRWSNWRTIHLIWNSFWELNRWLVLSHEWNSTWSSGCLLDKCH